MAAFDFDALFSSPGFQSGMGLLGASQARNPMMQAFQVMQSMEQRKREQEQAKQAAEQQQAMMQYRQAQAEQAREHARSYASQVAEQKRKNDMLAEQQATFNKLAPQILGGGLDDAQPQPAAPQPQSQAAPAVEQSPVKSFFRQRWLPVEGGIDPRTGVFRTSPKGAIGPAQVMPDTAPEAAQLAGLPFDDTRYRTDAEYNTRIGEAYFEKQFEDFGDLAKASAAYNAGPARLKEALARAKRAGNESAWLAFMPRETQVAVNKALGGRTGLQTPAVPRSTQYEPHVKAQLLGGLMMGATDPGKGLVEMGKALEPKTGITPGSYTRDARGNLTRAPNPEEQERLENERTRISQEDQRIAADKAAKAVEAEKKQADIKAQEQEMRTARAKDLRITSNIDSSLESLQKTAGELKDHPGLKWITGTLGGKIPPRLLGAEARNANAILEQLKGQVFVQASTLMRQASESGASVGQQSDWEGKNITAAMARLDQAQDYEQFKKALDDVTTLVAGSRERLRGVYEKTHGEKLPEPAKPRTIKRTGRSKGRKVVEYSDGSIEYVD